MKAVLQCVKNKWKIRLRHDKTVLFCSEWKLSVWREKRKKIPPTVQIFWFTVTIYTNT